MSSEEVAAKAPENAPEVPAASAKSEVSEEHTGNSGDKNQAASSAAYDVDYSRFANIGLEEEEEEKRLLEEKRAKAAKRRGGAPDDDDEPQKGVFPQGPPMSRLQEEDSSSDSDSDDDLHPLFWRKLPKEGVGEAYKQVFTDMIYDGKTPDELAEQFKENGNMAYAQGKRFFSDALQHYEEALEWSSKGTNSVENRTCYATILSNRAAINLAKKNYGLVKKDCEAAIKFGPNPMPNCKTHYRAAKACYGLRNWQETVHYAKTGLEIDPENKYLVQLRDGAQAKLKAERDAKKKKEMEQYKERKLDEEVRKACLLRQINVGPLAFDLSRYTGKNTHAERGGAPRPVITDEGVMQWPAILWYPEYSQSDFIQAFDERVAIKDQLAMMFPPTQQGSNPAMFAPWDEQHRYTLDNIRVFFQERFVRSFDMNKSWEQQYFKVLQTEVENEDYSKKRWIEVDVSKPLIEVLQYPGHVIPGVVGFHIITKGGDYHDLFVKQCQDGIKKM